MGLEVIVSEAEKSMGQARLRFRGRDGKDYSDFHAMWMNASAVWPRKKPDKKDSGEILSYIEALNEKLKTKYQTKIIDRAFPVLQVFSSMDRKEEIEKAVEDLGMSPAEKAVIARVEVCSRPTEYLRWFLGEQTDIFEVDERLLAVLNKKAEIESRIEELHKKISREISGKSRSVVSAHINRLHEIFEKYDGNCYGPVHENLLSDKRTRKLEPLFEMKKEISDNVRELDAAVKALNPDPKAQNYLKAVFHDRNKKKSTGSKDYCLDLLVDSTSYWKKKGKMSYEDYMSETTTLFDCEVPFYKRKNAEVSWNSFDSHNGGEIAGHLVTLRDIGADRIDGVPVTKCSDGEEFVEKCSKILKETKVCGKTPFIITTYNFPYDADSMNSIIGREGFGIGIDNEHTRYVVSVPMFKRLRLPGRIILDMLHLARMREPHLIHRKLDIVQKHARNMEIFKEINYDEMEQHEEIGITGETGGKLESVIKRVENIAGKRVRDMGKEEIKHASNTANARYVRKDTRETMETFFLHEWGKTALKAETNISQRFDIALPRFVSFNAIDDVHDRTYFENVGVFYDDVYPKKPSRIEHENRAIRHYDSLREKLLGITPRNGRHEKVYQVYVPPSFKLLDLMGKRPATMQLTDKFPRTADNLQQKEFYGHMLEAFLKRMCIAFGEYDLAEGSAKDTDSKMLPIMNRIEFVDAANSLRRTMEGKSEHAEWALKHFNRGTMKLDTLEKYLRMDDYARSKMFKAGIQPQQLLNAMKHFRGHRPERHESEKMRRRFAGAYAFDPEEMRKVLKEHAENIRMFMTLYGIEPVYAEGDYMFVKGRKEFVEKMEAPFVMVDELPAVYIAGNIHYRKYGYLRGPDKDHATADYSMFETKLFGGFIDAVLENKTDEAIKGLEKGLQNLEQGKVSKKDMFYYVKSSNTYSVFVKGKRQDFPSEDAALNASYDLQAYTSHVQDKARKLAAPIVGARDAKRAVSGRRQIRLF